MVGPKILYGILNWGLGHATRSSVVIQELIDMGCRVEVGCSGVGLEWLRKRFPTLLFHELPDPGITYQNPGGSFSLAIVRQALNLQRWLAVDQKWIKDYIRLNGLPDGIISDHRPAFQISTIPSALIAHQLTLPIPFWMAAANALHDWYLSRFDELWLPDHPDELLSGQLSKTRLPKKYLGYLSAIPTDFSGSDMPKMPLWIISGPEPLRTHWENTMTTKLNERYGPFRVVRGTSRQAQVDFPSGWEVVNLASAQQLSPFLKAASWVFCRAGYSTLMDLRLHGKPALLDPTPGQPEQERLAKELNGKFSWFDYRDTGFIDSLEFQTPQCATGADGSILKSVLVAWLKRDT
ncbi:MAG: glycosyltransferase [Bacteroidetes bacterium]|nr:glycosyltransferase [Bacteroidota bacterium]